MREEEYLELIRHLQEWTRQINEDLHEQAAVSARGEEQPSRFLLAYLGTVITRFKLESRSGARTAMNRLNKALSGEEFLSDLTVILPLEVEADLWEQHAVSLQELPDYSGVVDQLEQVVRSVRRDLEGPRRGI